VHEGVPTAFPPLPKDAPRNRLTLAKWLVSPENPLTARVIANRYWEQLFGTGLVRTSEEFGTQGELPTHPELLDWLATELVRQKWDVKAFLKLLVTSAAYRQSSKVTPEALEKDPDNRLLSRGPRVRLSAEMVRDQALVTLNDQVYVEAAQALARRVAAAPGDVAEKAKCAVFACLSRPAREPEVARLVALHDEAKAEFAKDAKKAAELATNPLGPAP